MKCVWSSWMLFSLKENGIFSFFEDSVPSLMSLAASRSEPENSLKRALMIRDESNNITYISHLYMYDCGITCR